MQTTTAKTLQGRYVLEKKLGQGGIGAVYLAHDRLLKRHVAIKLIAVDDIPDLQFSADDEQSLALAREFQTMASLRHPNIVSVIDYGFDNGQPYLVEEFVPEAEYITFAGREHPEKRRDLIVQFLRLLDYLHWREVAHRDLKPENVLVNSADQVKLIDFGFSVHFGERAVTLGTLAYIAPESLKEDDEHTQAQAALQDLYAFGVIFYEIVTGKLPFYDGDFEQMVDLIQRAQPDLSTAEKEAPIIGKLLEKKPENRYQSALEVLHALEEKWQISIEDETPATRESFLQAADFIGRTAERETLKSGIADMLKGKGRTILIGGESGVGKSRLIDEVSVFAVVKGAILLRGQAIQEGGTPYDIWRNVLRQMCLLVDLSDSEITILKALVNDIEALLERTGSATLERLETHAERERLFRTILAAFSRLKQPVVVILEDLQWADEESIDLVTEFSSLTSKENMPLLVLGTYRDDEAPDMPARVKDVLTVSLERFDAEHTSQLIRNILGVPKHEAIIGDLQRETEGNI